MALPSRKEDEKHTYTDLLHWPSDKRWELINGIAYDMSPAPTRRHQAIAWNLALQFGNFLKGKSCKAFFAPFDVRLPATSENGMSATTVLQPDLIIVCDVEKLDARGCVGSPTLVLEILSPETKKQDLGIKFHAYEQAGVPEYWVIWPADNTLQVYVLDAQRHYTMDAVYNGDETAPVGVLPGLSIDLAEVFAE